MARSCLAGLLGLVALSQPAVAAEAELDDPGAITVTATRAPAAVFDVPLTVTVFDDEAIANILATDLRELIRFEPGVTVRRPPARFGAALGGTGRAGNEGFNIRGLEGNRVLIVVDGVRLPDAFSFGAQNVGRGDYLDLGLVKSVEIVRGPASALYGSDGLAGAVAFTTTDPEDILRTRPLAALARTSFASADREFAHTAALAGQQGQLSALLAYTRRDSSELETQGRVGGVGQTRTRANPQNAHSNAVLGKLVWAPAPAHRVRLTFEHLDDRIDTQVLSGVTATVGRLDAQDTTRRQRAALDWRYTGQGLIESLYLAGYWQDGTTRQQAFEGRTTLPDRLRVNTFDNRVLGGLAEARLGFRTGPVRHRLVIGGDYSTTRQEGVRDGTVPPMGEFFPTRAFPPTDFVLAGAFVTDEISWGPLTLFPSLRFDHYDLTPEADAFTPGFAPRAQSGSEVTPRVGAVLKLGGGLSAFANWGRGFASPEPGQVNQFFENLTSPFFSYRSLPNPDLRPETSETWEVGLRLARGGFSASAVGFQGRYRDFISQEQIAGRGTIRDPIIFQFINLEEVDIHGAEVRAEYRARSGLEGRFAFAWAQGDSRRGAARLPLVSIDPMRVVGGLGWRDPANRFGGQLIVTHAQRKPESRTAGLCTPSCLRPDGFTVLDLTAFAQLTPAVVLRAGLFNLTDATYAEWSDVRPLADTAANRATLDAFTQPGRNASVSLTARF